MKKRFGTLHARTFCHATEDLDRVRTAMRNALGDVKVRASRTEGVHGNSIVVLETEIADTESIAGFLSRLDRESLEEIVHTLDSRIDESCNLFLRIDKQEAYMARVKLGKGDDVISIRIRISTFPARRNIASDIMKEFLSKELAEKAQQS